MSGPAALVVPALKRHTATVIVAHGLGDSGAGWIFLAENWRLRQKFEEVKFIFPNAPSIPITVNRGMRMPGWYDITNFSDLANRSEDEPGVLRSAATLHGLIQTEITSGIPSERIILGGFSQGGAMALLAGLTTPAKLGGIFGLSSYLLMQGKIRDMIREKDDKNKETKIFMGHGDVDDVVQHKWGKKTADTLKDWGYQVDFRTYGMLAHSADPEEIDDLETYLNQQIPPLGDAKGDKKEEGKM